MHVDVPQLAAAIFGGRAVPSITDDAAIAAVLTAAKAPLESMQLFAECAPGTHTLALWLL